MQDLQQGLHCVSSSHGFNFSFETSYSPSLSRSAALLTADTEPPRRELHRDQVGDNAGLLPATHSNEICVYPLTSRLNSKGQGGVKGRGAHVQEKKGLRNPGPQTLDSRDLDSSKYAVEQRGDVATAVERT